MVDYQEACELDIFYSKVLAGILSKFSPASVVFLSFLCSGILDILQGCMRKAIKKGFVDDMLVLQRCVCSFIANNQPARASTELNGATILHRVHAI